MLADEKRNVLAQRWGHGFPHRSAGEWLHLTAHTHSFLLTRSSERSSAHLDYRGGGGEETAPVRFRRGPLSTRWTQAGHEAKKKHRAALASASRNKSLSFCSFLSATGEVDQLWFTARSWRSRVVISRAVDVWKRGK